jgi:hypothetical protein
MSRPRARCAPTSVRCRRCWQPVGEGCRNLVHRNQGQPLPVVLYPPGIFHGCRIEDAENQALALEVERNKPSQDWNVRPTYLR